MWLRHIAKVNSQCLNPKIGRLTYPVVGRTGIQGPFCNLEDIEDQTRALCGQPEA